MHGRPAVRHLDAEVRLDGGEGPTKPDGYQSYYWRERPLHGATPMASPLIKRLWNDRRGAASWFILMAMIPLLGMISLGTEFGAWYVTNRHAQNAADAAAIAG